MGIIVQDVVFLFFFSSRRRHTRLQGDWSSDVCSSDLFDAFDALAIAYVLPVLIGMWKLAPGQIGLLIAAGFAGQLIGAIFFGWLAERIGRIPAAVWTIGIFSVFSIVCAFAWSYESMLVFRFTHGLGLGGEVPIAPAYLSQIAKADRRGRFF